MVSVGFLSLVTPQSDPTLGTLLPFLSPLLPSILWISRSGHISVSWPHHCPGPDHHHLSLELLITGLSQTSSLQSSLPLSTSQSHLYTNMGQPGPPQSIARISQHVLGMPSSLEQQMRACMHGRRTELFQLRAVTHVVLTSWNTCLFLHLVSSCHPFRLS